jgi:hypothetical protein
MRTPQELLDTLTLAEDSTSAIAVYLEAQGYIKLFEEVKAAALDCARADMQTDGVVHTKTDFGSAGWTVPKTPKLDRDRWAGLIDRDARLKALQDAADIAQAHLEAAQQESGCMVLPEARFYIKA